MIFLTFLYDFYHKSLSGTLLVYPRRMKTGVNLQSGGSDRIWEISGLMHFFRLGIRRNSSFMLSLSYYCNGQ